MRNILRALALVMLLLVAGGLLVAALARVGEASARFQCRNNLRKIGLAVHNYYDVHQHFPRAAEPNPDLPPERRLSWLLSVGPYFEATSLYVQMDKKDGWDAEENRYLALTTLRLLQCPAFPEKPPVSTLIPTHYVGMAGLGVDAVVLPEGDARAGFFGYEGSLTVAGLGKGTSAVLVALETASPTGAWTAGGPPTVRGLQDNDAPLLGANGQFGGLHRGGTKALFADLSVRFLSRSTDTEVMREMAVVDGKRERH
jgi:hypothetical protein